MKHQVMLVERRLRNSANPLIHGNLIINKVVKVVIGNNWNEPKRTPYH